MPTLSTPRKILMPQAMRCFPLAMKASSLKTTTAAIIMSTIITLRRTSLSKSS